MYALHGSDPKQMYPQSSSFSDAFRTLFHFYLLTVSHWEVGAGGIPIFS